MSTSYLEKLDRLKKDEYQKAAFESRNNTVVLAGPGSGKTTVLTLKAMHLLNGVISEPRGLACLTYSREAAREFTERLKELGLVRGKNIFLGTVHSFCLMLANPPYGKSWKTDAEKMGGKKDILDSRFVAYLEDGTQLSMIPRTSDGQLLFLLNNVSKMKTDTPLGSRIAEVHNASSLFTGDAGSGESNARRFLFESDLVEAIIALPENMFYNTKLATYIWVLSNKKEPRRVGKVQLIDASSFKSPLKRNMGKKNCELTSELRSKIVELFLSMEENEYSHIVSNSEFGYWKLTVQQPQIDEHGNVTLDKKGKVVPDKTKTMYESVPFNYPGGIKAYFENEVIPFVPTAWIDKGKTKIGYEVRFTRYFKSKAKEMYEKNIFSVTRQLMYSNDSTRLALDMCVFINGLPVITFELKNQLTKQNVDDAVQQYKLYLSTSKAMLT